MFRVEGRRRRHPQARPDESGESCGRHQSAHHQRREVTSSSSWRPSSVQPSWQLSSWPRYVLRKKIGKCLPRVTSRRASLASCLMPPSRLHEVRSSATSRLSSTFSQAARNSLACIERWSLPEFTHRSDTNFALRGRIVKRKCARARKNVRNFFPRRCARNDEGRSRMRSRTAPPVAREARKRRWQIE